MIQTLGGADIGVIGLQIEGARAVLGIAIHESDYWGRGFGTDAVRTLVDGAFEVKPLVRIELTVLHDNARAIRSYERAGFKREGVLRSHVYQNGRYQDVVMMSVLHEEWAKGRAHAKNRVRAKSRAQAKSHSPGLLRLGGRARRRGGRR